MVMRILAAGEPIPLDKMGDFTSHDLEELQKAVGQALWPVLSAAPTARPSYHAALGAKLPEHADTKIWTAEVQ